MRIVLVGLHTDRLVASSAALSNIDVLLVFLLRMRGFKIKVLTLLLGAA